MSWTAMADVPNPIIVDAAGTAGIGYVLKAYLPGTTTTTSIAIDSSGSSPQSTITANAEGKWEVSGNEIIPHIDRKHKWGIFANSTNATANTPFYMGPFDNVEQIAIGSFTGDSTLGTGATATITTLKALTGQANNDTIIVLGHTSVGDGGAGIFRWNSSSTATHDNGITIQPDAGGTGRWIRTAFDDKMEGNIRWYGVTTGDIKTAFQALYDAFAAIITIPPGTGYTLSAEQDIDRGIIIRGGGSCTGGTEAERIVPGGATGNAGEASTLITFSTTGSAFDIVGSGTEGLENVHIENLMIRGSASGTAGIMVGSGGSVTKSSLTNVFIEDFTNTSANTGNGLQIRECYLSNFTNVYIHGCNDGINVYGIATSLRFYNVMSRVNARYGMLQQQGTGCHFGDLTLEGNGSSGLAIIPRASQECGSNIFGPGLYMEQNNQSALGAAGDGYAIYIPGTASVANCRDIVFDRLQMYDNLGGNTTRLIYLDYCDRVRFENAILSTLSSGFMECTANTTGALINARGVQTVDPSNVTGNGYDSSGNPRVYLAELAPTMGTWTPTADANITWSGLGTCRWLRHGNLVKCWAVINVTAISGTGVVTIGGLPFAPDETQNGGGGCNPPGALTLTYITCATNSTVNLAFSTTWTDTAVSLYVSFEYYI